MTIDYSIEPKKLPSETLEKLWMVLKVAYEIKDESEFDMSKWNSCLIGYATIDLWFVTRGFRRDVSCEYIPSYEVDGFYLEGFPAIEAFFDIDRDLACDLFMPYCMCASLSNCIARLEDFLKKSEKIS